MVFVLDINRKPLSPCHEAVARKLLKQGDYQKYVHEELKEKFELIFGEVLDTIEQGRVKDGKHPFNNYVVINLDEPYIDEIVEIMKRHGHWG
jgi:hypothetical protein